MEYVKLKEDAHLVNLTRSKIIVETLTETRITCTTEEKVDYSCDLNTIRFRLPNLHMLLEYHYILLLCNLLYMYMYSMYVYHWIYLLILPFNLSSLCVDLFFSFYFTQDMYLYYFLLLYPGRTLVFVNSIDCLQRLRALLEVLHMKPLPLHAHMQQRQRLKNLDR